MLTTYATFSQSLNVNNTFKIEVPWYQKEEFRYCVPASTKFNNGRVYVWIHSPTKITVNLEVYYAYADDTDNVCWQGFPRLYSLSELTPEPQMDTEPEPQGVFSTLKDMVTAPKKISDATVSVSENVEEATKSIKKTSEKLEELVAGVSDIISPKKTWFGKLKKSAKEKTADGIWAVIKKIFNCVSDKIFGFVTHIVYAILSPTIKTVAWALVNLFHHVFGFSLQQMKRVGKAIELVWQAVKEQFKTYRAQTSPPEPPQGTPEPQMDLDPVASYSGLLFGLVTSFCKLKASPPSWKGVSDGLFGIGQAARSSYNFGMFMSDNVRLLRRVIDKILGLFGTNKSDYKLFAGVEDERLKTWLVESFGILAASQRENVFNDPDWTAKAFELSVVGKGILTSLGHAEIRIPPALERQVRDTVKSLGDLEQQMINRKCLTPARYEPWCCWIGGAAGCGKSNIGQTIAEEVSKNLGCRTSYYAMTAGQEYFDGFNHSSIFIDDFKSMSVSVAPQLYIQFLQMKSSVAFNPPFARVEDKDRFINFFNMIITSNSCFFKNECGIHDFDAYNRRRDFLIELQPRDPQKIKNPRANYTMEELEGLSQSRAYIYTDNRGGDDSPKIEIIPLSGETLRDAILRVATESASHYHEQEAKVYAKRCNSHRALINSCSGSTLDEYLTNVKAEFKKFDEVLCDNKVSSRGEKLGNVFNKWITRAKDSSSFKVDMDIDEEEELPSEEEEAIVPQVDIRPVETPEPALPMVNWPYCLFKEGKLGPVITETPPTSSMGDQYAVQFKHGEVMEPLERSTPLTKAIRCTHESFDFTTPEWLTDTNILLSPICGGFNHSYSATSTVMDSCFIWDENKGPIANPQCALLLPGRRDRFLERVTRGFLQTYGFGLISMNGLTAMMPPELTKYLARIDCMGPQPETTPIPEPNVKRVQGWQEQIKKTFKIIGDYVVPAEPRWKRFTKAFWNALCKIWEIFISLCKFLLSVIISISLVVCVLGIGSDLYQLYKDPTPVMVPPNILVGTPKPQLHPSGDFKTLKAAKSMRSQALKLMGQSQGLIVDDAAEYIRLCSSNNPECANYTNILAKVKKNVFFLFGDKDGLKYKARCTGLYNKKFLVVKHYIDFFNSKSIENVHVVAYNGMACITYKLSELKFQWTEGGYGVGELPKSYPYQFTNITKYMPCDTFDGHYPRDLAVGETFHDTMVEHRITSDVFRKPLVIPSKSGMASWTIRSGFMYDWGGAGKCGSLIFAPNMNCPLVGIHTAGIGNKVGYGELLFRETFVDSDDIPIEFVTPQMEYSSATYNLDGEYQIVGTLESSMMVHSPNETKITPSEISGVFPIMTQPAPLRSDDPRLEVRGDPFYAGVSKRCKKVREFPEEYLKEAGGEVARMLLDTCPPVKSIDVLTVKEAVEGLTIPGYEPIEMTTSEGYPWIKMRPKNASNKSWMFEFSEYPDGRKCLDGVFGDLSRTLELKDEMRARGLVPASYFTACLKDARILIEKTSRFDKTRIFEISPVDLTISQRQYFLDFDVSYQTSRFKSENTIGINPDGPEWSYLANSLLAFSPLILTADYSGYGPQLNQAALQMSFDISNVWLDWFDLADQETKDRRFNVREAIKYEVSQGLHVAKNLVFRPVAGLPSGNCETVIRNSLVNSLYIRMAFLGLATERCPAKADLYWFKHYVLLYHNGDDLIMAVKEEIIEWFNNETLIEWFALYGIKMTDALKSGKVRKYCSLEEATYLKRGFVKHPNRENQWMAPLEEASITDTANWIWKCVDPRQASLVNSEMCARLAYTRGEAFYNKIVDALRLAWLSKGVTFSSPKWISIDKHVWDNEEGPRFSF